MNRILNFDLLSNPFNWLVVFLVLSAWLILGTVIAGSMGQDTNAR